MNHETTARMLVSFYNLHVGTRYRYNRCEDMDAIIADDESNVTDIRNAIKNYATKKKEWNGDMDRFFAFYKCEWKKAGDTVAPAVETPASAAPVSQLEASMTFLSGVVANMVAQTKTAEIEQTVMESMKKSLDSYIAEKYGPIERKVTLVTEFGKKEMPGVVHEKFDTVLKFVANNEPVYLAGPAGSGKNVLCKQVADALNLQFYFTNAVTQEYKLTGFTDANGTFHESQFYKAFVNGGLFMLDEMDASIPEVLIILNAAIANRYFDFPAPIGKVEAHKDFRVIAAGNTLGHGADSNYVGRNTLDAASLDRFAMIEVDYDRRIELSVTNGNDALVSFCEKFRKACNKAGLQVTVSYRAMSRLAKMEALLDSKELLKSCLVKGLEKDDMHIIVREMGGASGKYMDALREIEKEVR